MDLNIIFFYLIITLSVIIIMRYFIEIEYRKKKQVENKNFYDSV